MRRCCTTRPSSFSLNCCFPSTRPHWPFWLWGDWAQSCVLWRVEHQIRVQTAVALCFPLSVKVVQSKSLPPPYGKLANSVLRWLIQNKGWFCYWPKKNWVFTFFLFVLFYLSAFSTSPPAFPPASASISNTILCLSLFSTLLSFTPCSHDFVDNNQGNWEHSWLSVSAAQKHKCLWWIGTMVQWLCVCCW